MSAEETPTEPHLGTHKEQKKKHGVTKKHTQIARLNQIKMIKMCASCTKLRSKVDGMQIYVTLTYTNHGMIGNISHIKKMSLGDTAQ